MGIWFYNMNLPDVGRLLSQLNNVESVSWSPNGTKLASGSDDGTIRVWQVE